jgi:hypothetical protein
MTLRSGLIPKMESNRRNDPATFFSSFRPLLLPAVVFVDGATAGPIFDVGLIRLFQVAVCSVRKLEASAFNDDAPLYPCRPLQNIQRKEGNQLELNGECDERRIKGG